MATKAYSIWNAAGRPFTLAQPVTELVAWAQRNGVEVLGTIGNEEHLQAANPQDHTPFSVTAWPVKLPGYIVCAADLNPGKGQGALILRDARAGKTPWLKYINTGHRHYDCRDGFQSSEYNSDEHDHLSIRTDWIYKSIGDFNPFGDAMTEDESRRLLAVELTLGSFIQGFGKTVPLTAADGLVHEFPIVPNQRLERIEAAVAKLSTGGIDIAALAAALAPLLPKAPTAQEVADLLALRLKD